MMGVQAPPGLLGIHTNMPCAIPPEIDAAAFTGAPPPPNLSAEERQSFDHVAFFYKHGLGYALEMGHRPQTLYGIADSPVALAAWIIDHDIWSYKLIARVFDGQSEGLTRGRDSRQHHLLLADEHGCFFGASLLGEQARLLCTERRRHPHGRECVPG
jgi:hypothetical protein